MRRAFRRDPSLLGWLGVGLVVRLLLMPFAVSSDLLAVYWRAHLIAYDGQLFSGYLVNMGAHYVHALSLRVLAPLLPPPDQVWTDPWWWDDTWGRVSQIQRAFSTGPDAFQTLFALKLPYLLADLGAGLLLLALVAGVGARQARRAWVFWMLSPIGLYATYVFGRYEAFAVVLVLAALLAVERDRPWLGAVLLGLAVTMRTYPLLLVPVFALVAVRPPLRQAGWAALALAPFGLVMLSNQLLTSRAGELSQLRDFPPAATFLAIAVPVEGGGDVYLLAVALLALYGVLLGRTRGWWGAGPVPVGELWLWLLVAHAALFACTAFSAHYFMWFTPFVALALGRRPGWRGTLPLHLAQCAAVFALTDILNGSRTTFGAFEPLAPELTASLPSLRDALLDAPALAGQALGLARSAFLVLTVLLAWPALAALARGAPQARDGEAPRRGQQGSPADRERRVVGQPA
jgi:hypothetical protein